MLACRKLHGAGLVPTGEDLLAVHPPATAVPSRTRYRVSSHSVTPDAKGEELRGHPSQSPFTLLVEGPWPQRGCPSARNLSHRLSIC